MEQYPFKVVDNGFDPEQVKEYVSMFKQAYSKVYEANQEQSKLIEQLKAENTQLKQHTNEQEKDQYDANVVGQTLIDAKALAQEIINKARQDAALIAEATKADETRTLERMHLIEKQLGAICMDLSVILEQNKKVKHDKDIGATGTRVYTQSEAGGYTEPRGYQQDSDFSTSPFSAGQNYTDARPAGTDSYPTYI